MPGPVPPDLTRSLYKSLIKHIVILEYAIDCLELRRIRYMQECLELLSEVSLKRTNTQDALLQSLPPQPAELRRDRFRRS